MILIILSLLMGFIGISVGSFFGAEIFLYLFGAVGVLSPGLYILERLHKKVKDKG